MEDHISKCLNCESELKEKYEFCPNCGQKTTEDLTLGVLFYNTISNYFSFDARFLKGFLPLMFKPGFLPKKFIEGKRLLYLHPGQMYLFVAFVFFFIFSFTARKHTESLNTQLRKTLNDNTATLVDTVNIRESDSIRVADSIQKRKSDSIAKVKLRKALEDNKFLTGMTETEIDSIVATTNLNDKDLNFSFNEEKIDSLIQNNASDQEIYKAMGMDEDDGWFMRKIYAQALKFYKARDGGNILQAFYDTIPIALFFLLPIFALILKVLYYKRGRYAHHLVFSFYYFSFLFTVFSIIFGINMIWDIPDGLDWLIAFSTFIYLLIALKRFYGQGWFFSFFKGSVATFTFMLLVIPFAAVIIALVAFMFY
ncbi:DUF3667 domain-containing protein [Psychroserpens algicola]|uniref:DUF3667 domain-containing protein n=1 Tax=Psychroserpens algicola TaxID=1719034 RepID=A0ABT0H8M1_9FLAO|nr:DUF3667 domain-containing protein [Psychroserpens algicola]MCK8480701.1 DUF3667 domain-containing protein [Psychroserpens algicola]